MWEEILKLAISNGLWAVLFVFLFIYELRDGHERERKYQATISSLAEKLDIVEEIRSDIIEIKDNLPTLTPRKKRSKNED